MLNNKVYLLQRYLTVNNFLYPTLIVPNESFCYCKTKLQMCKLWFMWICVFNIYVLLISFIYYCKKKFSIYMLEISIVLWILLYFKYHPHYEIFRFVKIKNHWQKYNFIFANKIHFWILWMEYTSSSKEHTISWNNKIVNYVYDNNILLKLSEEWIGKFR